jgi:G patch domain and KOW motifs-containing protein
MDVSVPETAAPAPSSSSAAAPVSEPAPEKWGLVERSAPPPPSSSSSSSSKPSRNEPLLMRNRAPNWDDVVEQDEIEKFRHDVKHRPQDVDTSTYERVPVEAFGEALLRGMGWQPGASIGLTGTGPVAVVEYVPRNHRLGLGAEPKLPEPPSSDARKRILKPGESRDPKPNMVYKDKDGRTRHVKTLDDKLVEFKSKELGHGVSVAIIRGEHEGMVGTVTSISHRPRLGVRLDSSHVEVVVDESEVTILGESDSHHHHSSHHRSDDRDSKHSRSRSRSRSRDRHNKKDKHHHSSSSSSHKRKEPEDHPDATPSKKIKSSESSSSSSRRPPSIWVRNDIRVRICSKTLKDGRFYCKKARVLDVISGTLCSVQVEPDRLVVEIDQRDLETVLPADGGIVCVVRGDHKGLHARLLSRGKRDSTVQIQFLEDLNVAQVSMDDVAEYMGPVST